MISYVNKALFGKNNVKKELIITDGNNVNLTNSDIYMESFELSETLCSETDLIFGSCNAACLKFTTSYLGELKGKLLTVKVVLNEDTSHPFQFGIYKVVEDKLTADRKKKEVVAYDRLYEIINSNVITWYNTLLPNANSTKTLKQFRDSFFSNFGITQETTTLDNDSLTITKTVGGNSLSGADVIKAICATNGCFGRINRNGKFEYTYLKPIGTGLFPSLTLYPSTSLYPSRHKNATEIGESGKYISAKYEDYEVSKITKLVIRDSDDEQIISVGSGTNTYIMGNNLLLYDKSAAQLSTVATNILNRIKDIYYTPCEIVMEGNPCNEIGDGFFVELVNGTEIVSYILNRVYKGIQNQKDTLVADGLEERTEDVNGISNQLYQLRSKTSRLTIDVDQIQSTVQDDILDPDNPLSLQSQITQNATDITAKVSKNSPTGQTTFSWEMTDSKMEWKANNNQIMLLNSSGLKIKGEVEATSGKIGDWTITSGRIEHEYNQNSKHTKIVLQADGTIVCYDLTTNPQSVKWALQCDGDVQIAGNANIAGYTKTSVIEANYATINSLNAVDAKFGSLNADNITAGTLSVNRLNIDGIVSSMAAKNLQVQAFTATGVVILGGKMCYWHDDGDGPVLHGSSE